MPRAADDAGDVTSRVVVAVAFTVLLLLFSAGYLWHAQPFYRRWPMATKITDRVYDHCHSEKTVSGELAKEPSLAPQKAAHRLYGAHPPSITDAQPPEHREPASAEDLQRAFECGNWGETRPSELFLRVYHDALKTLEHDPLVGAVSPPLMGSNGVIPLTVIGSIHDVIRHMVSISELVLGAD